MGIPHAVPYTYNSLAENKTPVTKACLVYGAVLVDKYSWNLSDIIFDTF